MFVGLDSGVEVYETHSTSGALRNNCGTYATEHTMDKPTSIIAALNAGKLPSTQQFNQFTDYLEHVGIVKFERTARKAKAGEAGVEDATLALSAQGKVLADDLRAVLSADKKLLNDKNG
jgi:hypothetical protein